MNVLIHVYVCVPVYGRLTRIIFFLILEVCLAKFSYIFNSSSICFDVSTS